MELKRRKTKHRDRRVYDREWYALHKDDILTKRRARRAANPEPMHRWERKYKAKVRAEKRVRARRGGPKSTPRRMEHESIQAKGPAHLTLEDVHRLTGVDVMDDE